MDAVAYDLNVYYNVLSNGQNSWLTAMGQVVIWRVFWGCICGLLEVQLKVVSKVGVGALL